MHSTSTAGHRWSLVLLILGLAASFLLLHPYAGLIHDSRLYTIQALSHLHPDLYGNDVFVRFGSQDDYTLFSPLFAWAVSWLGVEPAAAALTFAATCLFLAAAWLLARTLMSTRQAGIALLLLLIVPAYYGPGRVFYFLEGFVTPRQLAEALTLFSLTAWFRERRMLALTTAGCAMLIHPIIGLAGTAFLATLAWILPYWSRLWPWATTAAVLLVTLGLAGWLPLSNWQFDTEWYQIVVRRTYLVLRFWNSDDWGRVATVVSTLAVGTFVFRNGLRSIALAGLVITGSLLMLALVGGDLLRLVIVVQAQTWRVLWLATVLAILLLPPMFVFGWRAGPLTRCALLLLAAGWSAHYATPALVATPLAVAAAAFASRSSAVAHGPYLLWGAWATLGLVVTFNLATSLLSWGDGLTQSISLPPVLDEILTLCQTGAFPALIMVAAGYLILQHPSRPLLGSVALLGTAAILILALPAARTWTTEQYTPSLRESFAGWRARIPPGSDVMWVGDESLWGDGATNSWLLLERPSFISGAQAPNALFSRPAAIEMRERARSLSGQLRFGDPFRAKTELEPGPSGPLQLARVCQASVVRYVVTQANMTDATPIPAPASAPPFLRDYKLYICT